VAACRGEDLHRVAFHAFQSALIALAAPSSSGRWPSHSVSRGVSAAWAGPARRRAECRLHRCRSCPYCHRG